MPQLQPQKKLTINTKTNSEKTLKKKTASTRTVVLDEADKMLSSAGIAEQLAEIRQVLLGASKQPSSPPLFQCMLVSATMPSSVSKLASAWLGEGFASVKSGGSEKDNDDDFSLARVQTTSSSPSSSSSSLVTQVVTVCADHKKPAKLLKHLARAKEAAVSAGERHAPRVLVFANRIKTVRFVADFLRAQERKQQQAEEKKINGKEDKWGKKKGGSSSSSSSGSKIETLHGDRTQPERDAALASFRAGKATVLVATDVAARGLDVSGLRHVVNYDFPSNLESYEHRVGRAGRDGKGGFVASFFGRQMAPLAGSVVGFLQKSGQGVDPNLARLAESYEVAMVRSGGGGSGGREVEEEEGEGEKERRSKAAKVAAAESKGGGRGGKKRKRKAREDKVDYDDDDGEDDVELLAGDASDDDDDEERAAPVLGLYKKASGVGAKNPASKTAAATASNSNKRQKRKAVPGRLREKLRREKEKKRGSG